MILRFSGMRSRLVRLWLIGCAAATAMQLVAAEPIHLKLESDRIVRRQSPVSIRLEVGRDLNLEQTKVILRAGMALQLIDTADKSNHAMAAFEPVRRDRKLEALVLHWIQPKLNPKRPAVMLVDEAPLDSGDFFPLAFNDRKTEERLLVKDEAVLWRHGPLRFDPTDDAAARTHRHALHIGLRDDENRVRSVRMGTWRFGWSKVIHGDQTHNFWGDSPEAYKKHRMYLNDRQLLADTVARSVSMAHWKGSQGRTVLSETRSITTWAASPGLLLHDLQVVLSTNRGPVSLKGQPGRKGLALIPDPNWKRKELIQSESKGTWVAARFATEAGASVWCVQMLHPGDGGHGGAVSGLCKEGGMGLFTEHRIDPKIPLVLSYRLVLADAGRHPQLGPKQFERMYRDYLNPIRGTVVKP
ncbi:MAG: DUF6807 family protein [Phycisphaeraceae bacterium]|nr:DUF6807 family protein [Phycisphaeraceae bacterium]